MQGITAIEEGTTYEAEYKRITTGDLAGFAFRQGLTPDGCNTHHDDSKGWLAEYLSRHIAMDNDCTTKQVHITKLDVQTYRRHPTSEPDPFTFNVYVSWRYIDQP